MCEKKRLEKNSLFISKIAEIESKRERERKGKWKKNCCNLILLKLSAIFCLIVVSPDLPGELYWEFRIYTGGDNNNYGNELYSQKIDVTVGMS